MCIIGKDAVAHKGISLDCLCLQQNRLIGKKSWVITNLDGIFILMILQQQHKIGQIAQLNMRIAGQNGKPGTIKKMHKSSLYNTDQSALHSSYESILNFAAATKTK